MVRVSPPHFPGGAVRLEGVELHLECDSGESEGSLPGLRTTRWPLTRELARVSRCTLPASTHALRRVGRG